MKRRRLFLRTGFPRTPRIAQEEKVMEHRKSM